MTIALVFYLAGFFYRKNVQRHRILMGTGVLFTIGSAVALLAAVHLMHGGDRVAAGFVARSSEAVVLTHRVVASITFLAMFVMVWSGATRRRALHIAVARFFLPMYIVVYVSGLLIFTT